MSRFDCACQKGHHYTVFVGTPPEVCNEWRWERGPDSQVLQGALGVTVVNPIPVQCGALVLHAARAVEEVK